MKKNRIWAVLLRHLYLFRRSYDRLTEAFYWPVVDLMLWGITSTYVYKISPQAGNIIFALVGAVIFWNMILRGQGDISNGFLEELWNKNFVNLFVSPLKFNEMIVALIGVSLIKASASFAVASLFAFFLYKINVFTLGFYLIPFALLLLAFGWCLGFFVSACVLRFGTKIQTISWTLVWIFSPFSAVYFPVSALPEWAQVISRALPSSYVFESMRAVINTGSFDYKNLYISFALISVYLFLTILFIRNSFEKVLQKGLVKVY